MENKNPIFVNRLEKPAVFILIAGALCFFFFRNLLFYLSFNYGKLDTGFYEQALWLVGNFEIPTSNLYPAKNVFLSGHFMPAAFLFGLIKRMIGGLPATIFLDALHTSFTILPLHLICKRFFNNHFISFAFLGVFLISYTFTGAHFYPDNLAVFYFALALYLTVAKKFAWATLVWIFAVMFKEYYGLILTGMGASLFLFQKNRWGILWFFMGAIWFITTYFIIMPMLQPRRDWLISVYGSFGASETEIYINMLRDPFRAIFKGFNAQAIHHLASLILPLAFLPVIGFEFLIPFAPIFIIGALAESSLVMSHTISHYTFMVTPFFLVAGMMGMKRLNCWISGAGKNVRWFFGFVLIVSLILLNATGVKKQAYFYKKSIISKHIFSFHSEDVKKIKRLIPPDASLACSMNLLPYFSHRSKLYRVPAFGKNDGALSEGWRKDSLSAEYIIWDSFHEDFYVKTLVKAMEEGFSALNQPAAKYYQSDMFSNHSDELILIINQLLTYGYKIKKQEGSLILFEKTFL